MFLRPTPPIGLQLCTGLNKTGLGVSTQLIVFREKAFLTNLNPTHKTLRHQLSIMIRILETNGEDDLQFASESPGLSQQRKT